MVPEFSSSDSARGQCKHYHYTREKPDTELKMCSLEDTVCTLYDCQIPIFLGGAFPELLLNRIIL